MPIISYLVMSPVRLVIYGKLELALPSHAWLNFDLLQAWCWLQLG